MDQAIHVLAQVEDVPVPSGRMRPAVPDDLDLLVAWQRAFQTEAVGAEHIDAGRYRPLLSRRLAAGGNRTPRLWEDGEPVSLVGFSAETQGVVRVGPVYTPPEHRQRGYATRLVQEISAELLAGEHDCCLLYTDLANPTSNAIYRRIGYRVVCESAMISFGS